MIKIINSMAKHISIELFRSELSTS